MKVLTIIIPIYKGRETPVKESLKVLKDIRDKNSFEILLVKEKKDKSFFEEDIKDYNGAVKLIHTQDFSIEKVKSNYICFSNLSIDIDFEKISSLIDLLQKEEFEMINFPNVHTKHSGMNENFDEITSLKVLKKSLLMDEKFEFLEKVNFSTIMKLHFQLDLEKDIIAFQYKEPVFKKINEFDEFIIKQYIEAIRFLIYQFENLNNSFIKEHAYIFMEYLLFLIDKNIFLNNLIDSEQKKAYKLINNLSQYLTPNNIDKTSLAGYKGFLRLIEIEAYVEATEYMKLFRSRRHWFKKTQSLNRYFDKVPQNFEQSLSWKVTEPLRKMKAFIKRSDLRFRKMLLLTTSKIIKMFFFNKKIWLITERPEQAEDNGYFFFKFCRENYTNQKVYYIINKDSPHAEKIRDLGNCIYHSTLKHKLFMLLADVYISAWTFQETAYPKPKKVFEKNFKNQIDKKFKVCLQHGVIIHNISPYLSKEKYQLDLIISSSSAEKNIIQETLGYKDEEVAVTGLARFDNLHEYTLKRQILIMPTWRRSLFQINKNQFVKTDYYKAYSSLISNKDFIEYIEKKDIKVNFYVHNQMQKFLDSFYIEHPNFKFLTKENAVVSKLIKESSLLITDYSSVSSDFLYMDKPVILYQFDPHDNHHGRVKDIEYEDIGIVVDKEKEVIEATKNFVENEFKISEQYRAKSANIFDYKDTNNNKRIYQAILKAYNEKK
ncbi:hypothetical protein BSBH6_04246 [Bacillus subtilis]|nr:hypothetical protein BSBH6_04246 [Bacillus subtilis]RPK19894.1 hypothetical protein BH5_04247 [Bacillus subtilis]